MISRNIFLIVLFVLVAWNLISFGLHIDYANYFSNVHKWIDYIATASLPIVYIIYRYVYQDFIGLQPQIGTSKLEEIKADKNGILWLPFTSEVLQNNVKDRYISMTLVVLFSISLVYWNLILSFSFDYNLFYIGLIVAMGMRSIYKYFYVKHVKIGIRNKTLYMRNIFCNEIFGTVDDVLFHKDVLYLHNYSFQLYDAISKVCLINEKDCDTYLQEFLLETSSNVDEITFFLKQLRDVDLEIYGYISLFSFLVYFF